MVNVYNFGSVTGVDGTTLQLSNAGVASIKNTAVTPGSYTFSSITVDQQGRITAASSGAPGWSVLADVTSSGSAASVTIATGIASGYKMFKVIARGQKTTNSQIGFQFNGDTGNNYGYEEIYAKATTLACAGATGVSLGVVGEYENSEWCQFDATIMNEASIQKIITATYGGVGSYAGSTVANWTNTANEISSIVAKCAAGNFVDGFRFILLGSTG